jgi:hypothetical protein
MTTVDKSRSPYFDDYNADKGFQDVLFVPARAVQVRELNQIQSMFKGQLSRFSDHVFEDGSVVIPGETNYDFDLQYIQINIDNYSSVVQLLSGSNINIVGASGITANVKIFRQPEGADPATFFVEYISASTSGDQSIISRHESIDIYAGGDQITTGTAIGTGLGSKFTINSGVYYIKKRFVLVPQETVILDKYSSTPSKVVCIDYNESVVTENDDSSLFDNAQGTPNFTAPGAHRLKVDASLRVFDLTDIDTIPENCVEIFRVDGGRILKTYRGPDYSILDDVLAQRTYEESGDYTVKAFKIGFDTHDKVFGTADDAKLGCQLDPGIAYVRGYRIETNTNTNIELDKARDTGIINNSSISAPIGYYVEVENLSALPSVSALQSVSFVDVGAAEVGTGRVRLITNPSTNVYRLYLFDLQDAAGVRTTSFVSNAVTIESTDTVTFTADIIEANIQDPGYNSLVFPLSVEFVKTLNSSGSSDTSYSSIKQLTSTTDTNGVVTFSSAGSEIYVAQDSRIAFGSYTDDDTFFDVAGNFTMSGTPIGSIISIDLGVGNASRPVRVNLSVAKQEVVQKLKTLQQTSITGSLTSGVLGLGKADGYSIVSVTDNNANDVTSSFTLNPNKTQSYYGISSVVTTRTVAEPITVVFEYFSHGSGDYFGPDSYVDLTYEDIPVENGSRLSDSLDFRPRINDAGTGFTGVGSSVGNLPAPFSIIRADVEHYMKRIDKVYLNSKGEFGIRKGLPALDPVDPEDPDGVMVLYTLYIPPYTFRVSDVQAEKVNNRRYTMKDIGNIETRLSNVEYYVTLNLLEQEADSTQVSDPITGNNRFKNGFFTDRFIDHGSADFSWTGYHVSVDEQNGELKPEFSLNAIDLTLNTLESSGYVVNDNMITLPYEDVTYVRQNQRSTTINVNPYAIYRWSGSLKLNPSMDSWIDTQYQDPDVTYRVFNNGRLTQSWNSWRLNWTGETNIETRQFSRTSAPHSVWQSPNAFGEGVWNRGLARRTRDTFQTSTVTRTNIDIVNDRVLDTSVIPYMRTIDIDLVGEGNRPNSRMYMFFDATNINDFVRPDGGSFGDPVYTDVDGKFNATFRIPNNDVQQFRTGEKLIIATDEDTNQRQVSTSYAQSTFTSTGIRQIRQRTINATRTINTNTALVRRVWSDPLAQSFLVERAGGMFATKIRVFFSTKDPVVPIVVQIREMENGSPTQTIVPGGEKLLLPASVGTSTDGSVATEFVFDHPVYLQDGQEYCFVVSSNSNQYNAFIGRMGEQDLATGKFIVKQPYAGVLFKSQNNSTWTEDQQADLQFELFAAKFDTSVTATVIADNDLNTLIQLSPNPILTEIGSNALTIKRQNHNYTVGTVVTISNATGGNNIPANEINTTHTVASVVDPNTFTVDVTSSADTLGDIGGTFVLISDTVQASLLTPNIPVINLPGTSIEFSARGTTGKSIDGTETPYQVQASYVPLENDANNAINFPWLITNDADEAENLVGQKSFKFKAVMQSTNENISPVIDMSGAMIITPFTQIDNKTPIDPSGENTWATYRTNINPLSTPADMVQVYLDLKTNNPANVVLSIRSSNSQEEMDAADWITIPSKTSGVPADVNSFYEYEYEQTGIPQFSFYQIMIQLKSDSAVEYPVCKRLRVIALSDFS